ncbi:MAG: hypothetical protein K6T83_03705 [Alicyclobacillus sp.]|nr:hypothetical protein [Alicyclobacillus sp.]
MFVGTINEDLRALISDAVKEWDVQDLYVGCSGNFTIERMLKDSGFRMHGNDVSLYTCTIGEYLVGRDFPVKVNDPEYAWLEPYLEPGIPKIATILLCTSLLDGYGRHEPFFARRRKAYRDQWERIHTETCEKVFRALEGLHLASFWRGDCVEWAQITPQDAAFISFPPTYKAGYEKLYKAFDSVFEWQRPEYEIFDDDRLLVMVEAVKQKKHWIIAKDAQIPGLEEYEVGRVQTSLRSKPFIVYSNSSHMRLTMPHQKTEPVPIPRFGPDDEMREDSVLSVAKITQGQMNTLRSQYLNPGIAPASAGLCLAVLVDGKLIGAIGLSKGKFGEGEAYMMTDFAIRPTRYKRLSKLVLVAALSIEVRRLFEQASNMRCPNIGTTAFTDKAVSMKYRGLFELHSRKEKPARLNYVARMGRWTLREGYQWWLKNHAK